MTATRETAKNPSHYRNHLRRGLRRYREGKIGGDQLAYDVERYLKAWDGLQ